MSNKILFFGNERLATGVQTRVPMLQSLLSSGYEVPAVIVAQSPNVKSRQQRQLEVAAIAEQHDIPLLTPSNLTDAVDQIASLGAEAAVLLSYGKIIPTAILDLFPRGIINIHPSLLPLHRGSTPIESALLGGDAETGVSLMRLSNKMDSGPIYAQHTVALLGAESKQSLADKLSAIGVDMLLKNLPKVLNGSLQPVAQDDNLATYDQLITKADAQIDWAKPAAVVEREIRAYAGWPRSRTTIGSTSVIITGAHVSQGTGEPGNLRIEDKQLGIYCGENVLVIDSLIPTGKKRMSAAAFLAGYTSN